ncbi:MAG: head-tail connector protein [Elusimicrobiaceae bacterium]|jgi:uncharacterized phage protein (predicted DNA packaging)|nr:head-tail connector protein [Elusimicrobiaceae bacterium]
MRVSELTIDIVKNYLRVDGDDDNVLLTAILGAAVQYCISYTGLEPNQLNDYDDIPLAVLALCADMYDLRQFTVTGVQINPTVLQILGSHSSNLL